MIMGFQNQAADVIFVGRNQRVGDDFLKRQIGQRVLGCHTLLLRSAASPASWSPDFSSLALAKRSAKSRN